MDTEQELMELRKMVQELTLREDDQKKRLAELEEELSRYRKIIQPATYPPPGDPT